MFEGKCRGVKEEAISELICYGPFGEWMEWLKMSLPGQGFIYSVEVIKSATPVQADIHAWKAWYCTLVSFSIMRR